MNAIVTARLIVELECPIHALLVEFGSTRLATHEYAGSSGNLAALFTELVTRQRFLLLLDVVPQVHKGDEV
ncbi:hypothetical protein OH492_18345 [Vibrio chagasii]|nr:hypothetical protein [Vibrio chagasii]